jgi:hypothetical protein
MRADKASLLTASGMFIEIEQEIYCFNTQRLYANSINAFFLALSIS